MDCRDAARFVQLRLDDEIEPPDCIQLESHLERCGHCRRMVDSEVWFKSNVCTKLRDAHRGIDHQPPSNLKARILEAANDEAPSGRPVGRAVAACMAVSMVGALGWSATSSEPRFVDETVARHSRNLPPELRAPAADADQIDAFLQRNLRYSVAVPRVQAARTPTRLVGARLSSIGERDAAYVMYDHRGARVSLFAYPRADDEAPKDFRRRQHGGRELLGGQRRGYNVIQWRARDLEYSLVSDLDPDEMVHLAGSISGRR